MLASGQGGFSLIHRRCPHTEGFTMPGKVGTLQDRAHGKRKPGPVLSPAPVAQRFMGTTQPPCLLRARWLVGSLSGSTRAFLTLARERCITWAMWRGP